MTSPPPAPPKAADIAEANRAFYDALWWRAKLQRPEHFNTWPLVAALMPAARQRLEVGPGLRPRLPIAGTRFLDISTRAVAQLNARGGAALPGRIDALPFADRAFDLVCACDVIEHADDDVRVFDELVRVLRPGGVLICSVPLHPHRWTPFDDWVGHARRYEPAALVSLLAARRLEIEQSAGYGMQPSNPRWLGYGMWWLEHHPRWAMFWYNWVGMPLAMRFQSPLDARAGAVDMTALDEVFLVCRRKS